MRTHATTASLLLVTLVAAALVAPAAPTADSAARVDVPPHAGGSGGSGSGSGSSAVAVDSARHRVLERATYVRSTDSDCDIAQCSSDCRQWQPQSTGSFERACRSRDRRVITKRVQPSVDLKRSAYAL